MKNPGIYRRRRLVNRLLLTMSVLAAGFGLVWLGFILYALLSRGLDHFSTTLFTEVMPVPGESGGLSNAIMGSLEMCSVAVLLGTPLGLLAGTYLAEYGRYGRIALVVRFVNDILLSAPSIVMGLFVYALLAPRLHERTFSGWAGSLALMAIVIPVVVRTTENMLLLVPNGLREAAAALGAPRSSVIRAITWRAARAGIVTGFLLSVARISGETAPLMFTAFGNSQWSTDMSHPLAALPLAIFTLANTAYEDDHRLAWQGALLITATVLTLSILARILESSSRRSN